MFDFLRADRGSELSPIGRSQTGLHVCRRDQLHLEFKGLEQELALSGFPGAQCAGHGSGLNDVALRRRLVAEEPLAGLAAEVARVAHLLQQRTGAVFRIVETVVEGLHDVEHDVEADEGASS